MVGACQKGSVLVDYYMVHKVFQIFGTVGVRSVEQEFVLFPVDPVPGYFHDIVVVAAVVFIFHPGPDVGAGDFPRNHVKEVAGVVFLFRDHPCAAAVYCLAFQPVTVDELDVSDGFVTTQAIGFQNPCSGVACLKIKSVRPDGTFRRRRVRKGYFT